MVSYNQITVKQMLYQYLRSPSAIFSNRQVFYNQLESFINHSVVVFILDQLQNFEQPVYIVCLNLF